MMATEEDVRNQLSEMTESVAQVREMLPESADTFVGMGHLKEGIYKRTESAIEDVFDVCAMLNADLHLGLPGGDAEILKNLVQHDVISPDMQEILMKMKELQKILLRRYGAIDDAFAFSLLRARLDDFAVFRKDIEQYLESAGE